MHSIVPNIVHVNVIVCLSRCGFLPLKLSKESEECINENYPNVYRFQQWLFFRWSDPASIGDPLLLVQKKSDPIYPSFSHSQDFPKTTYRSNLWGYSYYPKCATPESHPLLQSDSKSTIEEVYYSLGNSDVLPCTFPRLNTYLTEWWSYRVVLNLSLNLVSFEQGVCECYDSGIDTQTRSL